MNLLSKDAKWDNVKYDFEAVKFHALQYLMGHRHALAKNAYQYVKHMEQTKGITVNLWSNSIEDDPKP